MHSKLRSIWSNSCENEKTANDCGRGKGFLSCDNKKLLRVTLREGEMRMAYTYTRCQLSSHCSLRLASRWYYAMPDCQTPSPDPKCSTR